jgi:uncharacterized protein YecE (DUF72 family)
MMRTCATCIGTSGWHYPHWRGPFYPEKLSAARMLEFYARHFHTVELNNTFYRLPSESGVAQWRDGSPAGFSFAAKGSRFLTHMKKLKDTGQGIERFFASLEPLGKKLGPIVFQLPPHWQVNAGRLEEFLANLPRGHRYAFELRDPTWHSSEIYGILRRHKAAFCIFEIAGFRSPDQLTADFTYVRLHGPGGAYQGSYPPDVLKRWAAQILEWQQTLRKIYFYFDNDQAAYAVENALTLKRLVGT